VVLIHLDDVQVVEGDRVRVGQSVLADDRDALPVREPDRS
jgi:hypothetical protein